MLLVFIVFNIHNTFDSLYTFTFAFIVFGFNSTQTTNPIRLKTPLAGNTVKKHADFLYTVFIRAK